MVWSDYDVSFILANSASMTVCEIADALCKTPKAVYNEVSRLGVKCKRSPQPKEWRSEELDILLSRYETTSSEVLAAMTGRSYNAVVSKLVGLGLRRPEEVIKTNQSNKIRRVRSVLTHKQRVKINNQVNYATQRGNIHKTPCIVCGELPVEAHHEDYDKPLDVVFLCHYHHMRLHRLKNQRVEDALSIIMSLRKVYEVA